MLFIFSGLPGSGKTTIARALAQRLGAVHVRIDTIEHALRDAGFPEPMNDAGYRVGYGVAEDNLRLGRIVIADSVNPLAITREAWREVARRAGARSLDVECVCSDRQEHRRRVETRVGDIKGFRLPTWDEVVGRAYEEWRGEHVVVDTARESIDDVVARLAAALA